MARNQKLTGVIQGRTLLSAKPDRLLLSLGFSDGSIMTIRLGAPAPSVITGGTVRCVRQRDRTIDFDFMDGSSLELNMAEATSCVMLRDRSGVLEYAD